MTSQRITADGAERSRLLLLRWPCAWRPAARVGAVAPQRRRQDVYRRRGIPSRDLDALLRGGGGGRPTPRAHGARTARLCRNPEIVAISAGAPGRSVSLRVPERGDRAKRRRANALSPRQPGHMGCRAGEAGVPADPGSHVAGSGFDERASDAGRAHLRARRPHQHRWSSARRRAAYPPRRAAEDRRRVVWLGARPSGAWYAADDAWCCPRARAFGRSPRGVGLGLPVVTTTPPAGEVVGPDRARSCRRATPGPGGCARRCAHDRLLPGVGRPGGGGPFTMSPVVVRAHLAAGGPCTALP